MPGTDERDTRHVVCIDCGDEVPIGGFPEDFYYGDGSWAGSLEHAEEPCPECGTSNHRLVDVQGYIRCPRCHQIVED